MKRAIMYGAGDLRLEDCPLDCERLEPDQLYVETQVTALSTGTDLGNYLGSSISVSYTHLDVYKRQLDAR